MLGEGLRVAMMAVAITWRWSAGREVSPSAHARDAPSAEEGWIMHVATKTKVWTLEEVHSLPDDGNKYELVRGELFVTPAPAGIHETILARLSRILDPYVESQKLGLVFHPRSVMRFDGSEVEPDLMVRQPWIGDERSWDNAPMPILIVEVFSASTRRRDQNQKKRLYRDARIAEYWMVDPERRAVTVVEPESADRIVRDVLTWSPPGSSFPLEIRVPELFV
jgi:Uma2 family endonuclease